LVEAINVDLFLMGVDGVDHEGGISFSSFEECLIAKEVLKRSKTKVVVADSSKFGNVAPYKVCDLDCVDYIVTNKALTVDNLLRKARLSRATVVQVQVSKEE
jgi:DeoR/GlpR family transcriptional regulator of sugar metabolism